MSSKQTMTLADKGQIFELYDKGKTLEEISSVTNFPTLRLRWCIEGIKGTSVWQEAINVWKEVREDTNTNERSRLDRRSTRTVTNDVSIRVQPSHRKEPSSIGTRAVKINGIYQPKTRIPRVNVERSTHKNRSQRDVGSSGDRSGRQGNSSLIETLRNNVDYRGE